MQQGSWGLGLPCSSASSWGRCLPCSGLFVGSGEALANGGPVGIWIAYCLMGTMVYGMMVALGEMATLFPVAGAFTHYATRFVDPALGFVSVFLRRCCPPARPAHSPTADPIWSEHLVLSGQLASARMTR